MTPEDRKAAHGLVWFVRQEATFEQRKLLGRIALEGDPCPVCGRLVPVWAGRHGRKRELHHECKELRALLVQLAKRVRQISWAPGEAGDAAVKATRGELQCIINQSLQRANVTRGEGVEEEAPRPGADVDGRVLFDDLAELRAHVRAIMRGEEP